MVADRGGVDRARAQGTRERSTPFGEVEALRVGMQPRTPSGFGATHVDRDPGRLTLTAADRDHPQQVGPGAPAPASHARAHRALEGTRAGAGDLSAAGVTIGEPDPWPSTPQSSAPCHEPCADGS